MKLVVLLLFLTPLNILADNYNLVLNVDGSYVKTDANISIDKVDKKIEENLKRFIKGFNDFDKSILKSFYLDDKTNQNLYKYRNLYSKVFNMSGKFLYQKGFVIDNQVYLIFGLNIDSTYQNYLRFNLEDGQLVFKEPELDRTPLGVLLMNMLSNNNGSSKQNTSLSLANELELKLNIDICIKGCVNKKKIGIFNDIEDLLSTNKFDNIPNYFHGRSKVKFSQWFKEIPNLEKHSDFERYLPHKYPLYILNLGSITIVAFAKSKEDINNFHNKIKLDIDIQHAYLLNTKSGDKIVNFYYETIIDDYLKELVLNKLQNF